MEIKLHRTSKTVELIYSDGSHFHLSCEYLRVYSPSAEVRGHGVKPKLVKDKQTVAITAIEPVGRYAVKFIFDDGHRTGLYTFPYLYELATQYDQKWQDYLQRIASED